MNNSNLQITYFLLVVSKIYFKTVCNFLFSLLFLLIFFFSSMAAVAGTAEYLSWVLAQDLFYFHCVSGYAHLHSSCRCSHGNKTNSFLLTLVPSSKVHSSNLFVLLKLSLSKATHREEKWMKNIYLNLWAGKSRLAFGFFLNLCLVVFS